MSAANVLLGVLAAGLGLLMQTPFFVNRWPGSRSLHPRMIDRLRWCLRLVGVLLFVPGVFLAIGLIS